MKDGERESEIQFQVCVMTNYCRHIYKEVERERQGERERDRERERERERMNIK